MSFLKNPHNDSEEQSKEITEKASFTPLNFLLQKKEQKFTPLISERFIFSSDNKKEKYGSNTSSKKEILAEKSPLLTDRESSQPNTKSIKLDAISSPSTKLNYEMHPWQALFDEIQIDS